MSQNPDSAGAPTLRATLFACSTVYASMALYQSGGDIRANLAFLVVLIAWPSLPIFLLLFEVVFILSEPTDFMFRFEYARGVSIIVATSLALLAATVAAWRKGRRLNADWLKSAAALGWFVQGWLWAYPIAFLLIHGANAID